TATASADASSGSAPTPSYTAFKVRIFNGGDATATMVTGLTCTQVGQYCEVSPSPSTVGNVSVDKTLCQVVVTGLPCAVDVHVQISVAFNLPAQGTTTTMSDGITRVYRNEY